WYRTAGHDLSRHHNDLASAINLVDAALWTGLITADQKERLRAQTAFLGYALTDPAVISPERGYAANPNMTTATRSALGVTASLFSNHPQSRAWAATALTELSNALTYETGPNGDGGFNEAPHYANVGLDAFIALAIATRRAGLSSTEWLYDPRFKGALRWMGHIVTPR